MGWPMIPETPREMRWETTRQLGWFAILQVAFVEIWRKFDEGAWAWFPAVMLFGIGILMGAFAVGAVFHLARQVYGASPKDERSSVLRKLESLFLGHFAGDREPTNRVALIAATLVSFALFIFECAILFSAIGVVDRLAFSVEPLYVHDALLLSIEIATGNYGDVVAKSWSGKVLVMIEMIASLAYLVFILALAADAMRRKTP